MDPRSKLFKSLLWRAFSAGDLAGISISPARSSPYHAARFYFRHPMSADQFATSAARAGLLAPDISRGTARGQVSGKLAFVQVPLSATTLITANAPVNLAARGGLLRIMQIHAEVQSL